MELRLKTLTQVHIGNSQKLSPYSDYIYKDGFVYYIDFYKLEDYLYSINNTTEIIDDFVNIIRLQANSAKKDKYKLIDFFNRNNLSFIDFTNRKLKVTDEIKEEINRQIVSGGRPYIPGSSLKGAIRTALIYDYLDMNGYDFEKTLNNDIGAEIFGKFGDDKLKFLHVSDSLPFSEDSLKIIKTYRYHLKERQTSIPIVKEVISEDFESSIRLQTKADKRIHKLDDKLNYLYQNNEKNILRKINKFYIRCLERELEEIKKEKYTDLANIIEQYTNILNEAIKLDKLNNGAILRIGSGKTYFENTISLLFNKMELNQIIGEYELGDPSFFPVTRLVGVSNGVIRNVLGWIKLEVI